ncbi:hypothetical protein BU15DRAFT_78922 [Melanogaster broomeanus]|nr:hypothetical protein BU15DRAFT_78922 [Melanogaster broomeanus]
MSSSFSASCAIFAGPGHLIHLACSAARYQSVMHTILATRMQLHLRKLDSSVHRMDPFPDEFILPMSFKPVDPLYDA